MVFPPGQTLQNGKYKLEATLGKGGFGLTYRAHHTGFQAPLVLKSPNDELQTDPEYAKFVARFLKEGQMLWDLSQQRHGHIVRVTDLFEEMGVPWLAMDYIRGESLFDRVQRKGALPEAEAIGFMEQMGSALLAVHGAGLVHRDAHPGNIMILPPDPRKLQREAILIDFGIAGEMFPSTVSSKFFGNPAFAPYEQFGMPADPSMDVYTLAASCYFAVTGVFPESAMNRKLYGRGLVPPQDHRQIDRRLNAAIVAGMALEAIDRPSLSEWLNLLALASLSISEDQKVWNIDSVYLNSQQRLSYNNLLRLLKLKKWKEADEETANLLCKAVGRSEEGWLSIDDIKRLKPSDLSTINCLWIEASQGRYGFSIQKQIWQNCGSPTQPDQNWQKFCNLIGWRRDGKNLKYHDLQFKDDALTGHLPGFGVGTGLGQGWVLTWDLWVGLTTLFHKLP